LRDFKGRKPLFLLRILPFHNMNVEFSMGRMQREKTKSKRAQGQAGRPHFAPKNSGFSSKIPLSITQFTPTPDFGNLERKFGKKIFRKGNPILKITMLLRSRKPVDRGANHTYSTTTNFYFY
jgi:hypothetical protein